MSNLVCVVLCQIEGLVCGSILDRECGVWFYSIYKVWCVVLFQIESVVCGVWFYAR